MQTPSAFPTPIPPTKTAWSTAAFLLVLAGCGSSPDSTLGLSPPAQAPPEVTGTTESTLVTGATDVSKAITPNSAWQSETAAATNGPYQLVAYNAEDNAHIKPNGDFCAGYSESALAYNSNNTWRYLRFTTPSGIAMLRGDPGVSVVDAGSTSIFVVSSLALTTAAYGGMLKQPDGCVSPYDHHHNEIINDLCYTAVVVPKDQSPAFFYGTTCVHPSVTTDQLDGSSVYADVQNGNINAYAAYWNMTRGTIETFKNGVALPNPFPGTSMNGHAKFMQDARNVPTVVAPDSDGHFWLARLNESTSLWYTFSLTTASDPKFWWDTDTALGDGTQIGTGGYSGDVYPQGDYDNMVFFYPTLFQAPQPGAKRKSRLIGVYCNFILWAAASCTAEPTWRTDQLSNAIFPAVAVANVGGSTFYPAVTYWTDTATGGTLTLNVGTITASTLAFSVSATSLTQHPCVYYSADRTSYWGDYDGMAIYNNGSSLPLIARYFTDSTGSTCSTPAGLPMHVSQYAGLP